MRALSITLCFALLVPLPVLAADPAPPTPADGGSPLVVLPPDTPGGPSFAVGAYDEGAVTAIASGDGARLVAHGSLLVIAGDAAGLRVAGVQAVRPPVPAVELLGGSLRLLAGSSEVRLILAGTAIGLRRAELLAVRRGQSWALEVAAVSEGGAVTLLSPPRPADPGDAPAAEASAEEAPAPEPAARLLGAGEVLVLAPGSAPLAAPRPATTALATADETLALDRPSVPGRRLPPIPVEDPADFAIGRSLGGLGGAEIEIEAVEVEIGCVEICVD